MDPQDESLTEARALIWRGFRLHAGEKRAMAGAADTTR
jgi:hypothetical protein